RLRRAKTMRAPNSPTAKNRLLELAFGDIAQPPESKEEESPEPPVGPGAEAPPLPSAVMPPVPGGATNPPPLPIGSTAPAPPLPIMVAPPVPIIGGSGIVTVLPVEKCITT